MKSKLLLTVLSVIFFFVSFAQIPEPLPNTYINDLSGKLSKEQIEVINQSILQIEKNSSVQIAIILINDLPENIVIEDYAREVGRKWHVGNARNGIVYVAAINKHKQRLEISQQLEGDIPDVEAKNITDNIKPFFRSNDFYGGINSLLSDIRKRVDPVAKEQLKLQEAELKKKEQKSGESWFYIFLWTFGLGIIGLVWYVIFNNKKKKKANEDNKKSIYERLSYMRTDIYRPTTNSNNTVIVPPIIIEEPRRSYEDNSYNSSSSSSNSSSSNDSSSYGNWGSGSSDTSSSSDSGFSGGGSSSDW